CRHGELVLVAPAGAPLKDLLERASAHQPLRAGISLPVPGLGQVGRAHRDARRALELASSGRVVPLADVPLLDYLVAAADDTAGRLVPAGLDLLPPALRETLLAFVECDLNAGRTAGRLQVHPNTIHYRLRRIE